MKKVKLEDVCYSSSSSISQKDIMVLDGKYPIYGASGLIKNINYYKYEKEYIGVVKDGAGVGRTMILPAKSSVISTIQYILPKENINTRYLYYVLSFMNLSKYYSGVTIPHIYFKDYKYEELFLPNKSEQQKIVGKLDLIQEIIDIRKKQIKQLDELIKSQFVEMFGDPILNSKKINYMEMPSVCEIIDGDRGKNYPKAEEFFDNEYCLFLNAKNVTNTGFSFDNCMFITKEKDEKLRNGKLQRGDVVLTTRGTVGNLAFYAEDIPFENVRINSGMVILRMKKDLVNEIFFIEQFKMQLDNIKNKIANGSAQPQLPIIKMNGIKVLTPPIELQNKFAEFVKQIDKQKFEIQESLKEIQKLQESLMNKYFG